MNQFLRLSAKRTLFNLGHYHRHLAAARFPGVAVLGYHGVRTDALEAGRMAFPALHVRERELDAHCALIKATCHPITLAQYREARDGGPLPERPVLVTFDDGYRSVLTLARPILERHGIPAVVFLCSRPVEERTLFWFDAIALMRGEAHVHRLKNASPPEWSAETDAARTQVMDHEPHAPLTVQDVKDLAGWGMEFGGHTATHPILAQFDAGEQQRQVVENRDAIDAWTGRPPGAFAYPNGEPGDYNRDTVQILGESKYRIAFTTVPGFSSPQDGFDCNRFLVLADTSDAALAHGLCHSWRTPAVIP
jgi:peptidoglycan/xylan/chitin deacetylase (PgdA/CDA1 family)